MSQAQRYFIIWCLWCRGQEPLAYKPVNWKQGPLMLKKLCFMANVSTFYHLNVKAVFVSMSVPGQITSQRWLFDPVPSSEPPLEQGSHAAYYMLPWRSSLVKKWAGIVRLKALVLHPASACQPRSVRRTSARIQAQNGKARCLCF